MTRAAWGALDTEAHIRGLRIAVERTETANGQALLRIRLRDQNRVNRWSSTRPAAAGIELDTQALALVDALRRSPR